MAAEATAAGSRPASHGRRSVPRGRAQRLDPQAFGGCEALRHQLLDPSVTLRHVQRGIALDRLPRGPEVVEAALPLRPALVQRRETGRRLRTDRLLAELADVLGGRAMGAELGLRLRER